MQVAEQLHSDKQTLSQIFFYEDGVYAASSLNLPEQDAVQVTRRWQNLIEKQDCPAHVCVAAATRRGIINDEEAGLNNLESSNLAAGFQLTGLGDWVELFENHQQIKQLTFK